MSESYIGGTLTDRKSSEVCPKSAGAAAELRGCACAAAAEGPWGLAAGTLCSPALESPVSWI